jgi:hypothetical protein
MRTFTLISGNEQIPLDTTILHCNVATSLPAVLQESLRWLQCNAATSLPAVLPESLEIFLHQNEDK